MQDVLIKNGTIVTAAETFRADVRIENGKINALGSTLEKSGAQVIDASGCYVMPGGVDVHTHLNLTVGDVKVSDGFFEGTAAAAFGGTTCIVEHPGFGPDGCSLMHQIQAYKAEAAGECVVDFGLHGVVQHLAPQILDELPVLMANGVSSLKIYLTYTGRLEDRQILQILDCAQKTGMYCAFHAENHAIIDYLTHQFLEKGSLSPEFHPKSRPDACEAEAVHRILRLAETVGNAPVYIVHLSTKRGLRIIEAARNQGLPVTAEVCPQHLLLNDSCYREPDHQGLKYIMAPPARKPKDSAALWKGLSQGSIAVVATDHCSFSLKEKILRGKDNFSRCPGGIPGVETRLPLLFSEGVLQHRISLNRFVEVVSTAPARLIGLYPAKGNLNPGADADVVVFDPNAEKTLTSQALRQNADYSPFEGRIVRGWPVTTLVRGRVVMHRGELLAEKGWGKFTGRGSSGRP